LRATAVHCPLCMAPSDEGGTDYRRYFSHDKQVKKDPPAGRTAPRSRPIANATALAFGGVGLYGKPHSFGTFASKVQRETEPLGFFACTQNDVIK